MDFNAEERRRLDTFVEEIKEYALVPTGDELKEIYSKIQQDGFNMLSNREYAALLNGYFYKLATESNSYELLDSLYTIYNTYTMEMPEKIEKLVQLYKDRDKYNK